ncbi:MAG: RecX family transcriptional regulator [Candidatus Marinimicrobia bacterium]|nr:RecX family transcriptional regulator [Candidatus Neomarinimicrobiota bacterium]
MGKITAITQQKKMQQRFSIFVDGKFELGVDGSLVLKYDLKVGDEFTPKIKLELEDNDRIELAYNGLLNYIGYRERCEYEVHEWLFKKNYADLEGELIGRLKDKNYLSDERFARLFARDRVKLKSWGPIRLRQELGYKRISNDIIESAIEEIREEYDFDQLAHEQTQRKLKTISNPTMKDKKRLWTFLQRRGFESSSILKALGNIKFQTETDL